MVSDAQPKLTTKSGMAKGTTTSTAQIRRPGRSVRSTHQAARVPMTAHRAVTTTVSRTVFQSSVAVSGRKMRWKTVDPGPGGFDQQEDERGQQDDGDHGAGRQEDPRPSGGTGRNRGAGGGADGSSPATAVG